MTEKIAVRPFGVALRGVDGAIVRFTCELPAEYEGTVRVWATCGQRWRFPVPARIVADYSQGAIRKVIATVQLPAFYSACTLHVIARKGGLLRFASCRVPDARFRTLAKTAGNAENDYRYHEWFLANKTGSEELERQRSAFGLFAVKPLISIVTPVFRTPAPFLTAFISSMLAQTYENFEVVLVNVSGECPEVDAVLGGFRDERIRVIRAPNGTISENTNVGIEASRGEYIGFADHDDFVEPDALYRYVEAINEHPDCDLLFCDEDLWDADAEGGRFRGARFKPGWNPDLLLTHNYVCHLLMVSRRAIERVDLSGAEVNGAQDYDLTLKVAEIARCVCHVEGVLYHWRKHAGSTAANHESKPYAVRAGMNAIQRHFDRMGISAEVAEGTTPFSYRVLYQLPAADDVTLVLVEDGLDAVVMPVGSAAALGGDIEVIACGRSAVNAAVGSAHGSHVVVLDGSVDVEGSGWLAAVVGQLGRPSVGCSAPLIANRDGVVQSSGLLVGADGVWRHGFDGYLREDIAYMLMLEHVRDVSAVPLRCLAFRKADFERVGGFDVDLPGDWPAVDFSLKLLGIGLATVLVPWSVVLVNAPLHDLDEEALSRLMRERYGALAHRDPFVNSLLDQSCDDYLLDFDLCRTRDGVARECRCGVVSIQ